MRTELTERLGLRHPIVQAPMAGVSGPALATAVSAAGGLGMLSAGPRSTADDLRRELAATDAHVGAGLLAWRLRDHPGLLDAALVAAPAAVSISAGDVTPYADRVRAAGIPLFVQVPSAEAARRAAGAGADFVVAQGTDAGGHTGSVGTLPLLEAVLAAVEVPVLAAGGIASGRGLAGVLAMGAAGAWVGTRFAATREALGSEARKQRIVAARETDTVHTRVFDIAQGLAWPEEFPGRALRSDFTDRWHGREHELRPGSEPGVEYVYAGTAAGAIDDLPPAGEIVGRLSRQAEALLGRFV